MPISIVTAVVRASKDVWGTLTNAALNKLADESQTASDVNSIAASLASAAEVNAKEYTDQKVFDNVAAPSDSVVESLVATPASLTRGALEDSFTARRVHLIGLVGQSNMSGRGADYSSFKDPAHPRILQYGSGASSITSATEPLDMHDVPTGIGPGLQFAREWIADLPEDDVIVLIPAAHGSTPLVSNVTPLGWRYGVSGNLTSIFITQALAAKTAAETMFDGATVAFAGILWFQGETDSATGVAVTGTDYRTDLLALIAGIRASLSVADLPWISMGFIPEAMDVGTRAQVQGVQSYLPYEVANTGFVEPPPVGYSNGDALHANADGHRLFYAPRAYDEFRRIRGRRAATNEDLSVPTPTPSPTLGATIWTDSFTAADIASRTTTDTGGFSWATVAADGVNASTFGIKSNAGAVYRAAGLTTLFALVDAGATKTKRFIDWDWGVLSSANCRPVFCFADASHYYTMRTTGTTFDVRRYDSLTTFVTIATATVSFDTTPVTRVLIDRPDPLTSLAYLSVWVDSTLLVNALAITSYVDNTKDGVSYLTNSTVDAMRLNTITVSAVA